MLQIYKKGIRKNLKFETPKGVINMFQLWGLTIPELDALAVDLQEKVEKTSRRSFITSAPKGQYTAKLRFEIVYDILQTKVREDNEASKKLEDKAYNAEIDAAIVAARKRELSNLSEKELLAMKR